MRTVGVVAEYDPFHNGHALHMKKTREAGAERIVCLMSGNFVQRGEIAAFSLRRSDRIVGRLCYTRIWETKLDPPSAG